MTSRPTPADHSSKAPARCRAQLRPPASLKSARRHGAKVRPLECTVPLMLPTSKAASSKGGHSSRPTAVGPRRVEGSPGRCNRHSRDISGQLTDAFVRGGECAPNAPKATPTAASLWRERQQTHNGQTTAARAPPIHRAGPQSEQRQQGSAQPLHKPVTREVCSNQQHNVKASCKSSNAYASIHVSSLAPHFKEYG